MPTWASMNPRRSVMTSATRLLALLLLGACAKKPDLAGAVPAGDFLVRLRLDPDPPRAAANVLHLELTDAQGKPIDGAQIGFISGMPAMGAMPEMKAGGGGKALGSGKYDVDYSLSMSGDWPLNLGVDAPGHPHADLHLKVSPPRAGYTLERRGAFGREGGPRMLDLSPERQQLIGVVYAKVERRPLNLSLRASGRVELDETRVNEVVLKYDSYIEKLFVDQTGQRIRKGDALLTLYGPDLLSAEQDYLIALRTRGVPGSEQLARAAEERLRLWNLNDAQLADLRNRGKAEPRMTIHSPADGTVLEKNVVAGSRAMAGMVLYRIGNLGSIWVIADLFESDAPYVR